MQPIGPGQSPFSHGDRPVLSAPGPLDVQRGAHGHAQRKPRTTYPVSTHSVDQWGRLGRDTCVMDPVGYHACYSDPGPELSCLCHIRYVDAPSSAMARRTSAAAAWRGNLSRAECKSPSTIARPDTTGVASEARRQPDDEDEASAGQTHGPYSRLSRNNTETPRKVTIKNFTAEEGIVALGGGGLTWLEESRNAGRDAPHQQPHRGEARHLLVNARQPGKCDIC
jgi:hypothetical protein